jgi:hypothetical protein
MNCMRNRRGGIRSVLLAILFTIACAAITGVIASRVHGRVYRSSGMISVPPVDAEQSLPKLPGIPTGRSQEDWAELIRSARVTDEALQDPIWKSMNVQVLPPEELRHQIDVRRRPHSQLIEISFTSQSPAEAAAAVTSVINATATFAGQQESVRWRNLFGYLDDRKASIASRRGGIQSLLDNAYKDYGSDDLRPFVDAAAHRLDRIQSAITEIDIAMATSGITPGEGAPTSQPADSTHLNDPTAGLKKLRSQAVRELTSLEMKNALIQDQRHEADELKADLATIDRQISDLRASESLSSGVEIISTGEIALQPEPIWQGRHVRHAAAIGGGVGVVLALLVVSRRRTG